LIFETEKTMAEQKQDTASALKDIISHAKEYGFVLLLRFMTVYKPYTTTVKMVLS
jgi:hypothetical protein